MMKVVAISGFDHGGLVRRGQVVTVSEPTGAALIQRGLVRPERTSLLGAGAVESPLPAASAPAKPAGKSRRPAP